MHVEFLEKDLEDWVCNNIESVAGKGTFVIGRQMRLANGGVLDVLAGAHRRYGDGGGSFLEIVVIEIKKDRIETSAVTQLLSYMGALGEAKDLLEENAEDYVEIQGLLVAPAISHEAALCVSGIDYRVGFVSLNIEVEVSAETFLHFDHSTCREDLTAEWAERLQLAGEHQQRIAAIAGLLASPEVNGKPDVGIDGL